MHLSAFDAWLRSPPWRPLVMGVLNVTPDSFSDGGRFEGHGGVARAVEEATAMVAAGADLIDVGGESTRPGARPVPEAEQIRRVVPVLNALRDRPGDPPVTISIDTTRAAVAGAALDAGAHVVNDISAGRDDPAMFPLVARRGAPIVLMHMRGTPATMQVNPVYRAVTREVAAFLEQRTAAAAEAGVDSSKILLDPGIGFGKTVAHNLELLRRLGELVSLGRPILVGTSRKAFTGKITGRSPAATAADEAAARLFGTAATVAWAVAHGAAVVRVHDVGPMSQVTRAVEAIQTGVAT